MAVEVLRAPGGVVSASRSADVASSTSWTELASATLGAGTWLVVFTASFGASSSGRRGVRLAWGASGTNTGYAPPVAGAGTTVQRCYPVRLGSATEMRVLATQNSGSQLAVSGGIRAVRLA